MAPSTGMTPQWNAQLFCSVQVQPPGAHIGWMRGWPLQSVACAQYESSLSSFCVHVSPSAVRGQRELLARERVLVTAVVVVRLRAGLRREPQIRLRRGVRAFEVSARGTGRRDAADAGVEVAEERSVALEDDAFEGRRVARGLPVEGADEFSSRSRSAHPRWPRPPRRPPRPGPHRPCNPEGSRTHNQRREQRRQA